MSARLWAQREHATNKIRPRVKCHGCGILGCVTYWGDWCFDCNVKRMDRLDAQFAKVSEALPPTTQE